MADCKSYFTWERHVCQRQDVGNRESVQPPLKYFNKKYLSFTKNTDKKCTNVIHWNFETMKIQKKKRKHVTNKIFQKKICFFLYPIRKENRCDCVDKVCKHQEQEIKNSLRNSDFLHKTQKVYTMYKKYNANKLLCYCIEQF